MNRIEQFIKKFREDSKNEEVLESHFTNGYCYHFAVILATLFFNEDYKSHIMYNPIDNHFAIIYNCELYDITGKIELYNCCDWHYWDEYKMQDELETDRIIKQCIYKEEE